MHTHLQRKIHVSTHDFFPAQKTPQFWIYTTHVLLCIYEGRKQKEDHANYRLQRKFSLFFSGAAAADERRSHTRLFSRSIFGTAKSWICCTKLAVTLRQTGRAKLFMGHFFCCWHRAPCWSLKGAVLLFSERSFPPSPFNMQRNQAQLQNKLWLFLRSFLSWILWVQTEGRKGR